MGRKGGDNVRWRERGGEEKGAGGNVNENTTGNVWDVKFLPTE